jgi:DNA repair exonuclease SbcCD ATPase subunit
MEMITDMLAPDELFAPAAPAELNALALLTIKPEEYVAQVFAPFRSKLATLKAEADTIHFEDDRMFDAPHRYVDISTTEGMAIGIKYRAALRREVRLDAKDAHSNRKAPILQIGRLLDSTLKAIVDEVTPYEEKFDAAIKAEEKRKADIAAAKERAKAERIGAIKAAIEAIRTLPAHATGMAADDLRVMLESLAARTVTKEKFAEFADEAQTVLDAAGLELVAMFGAAQQRETIAAEAEAARIAEAARLAAEQADADKRRADEAAENARVAAENERVANELAAATRKLAEQQAAIELLDKQRADQAAANLKAEADARAEADRKAQAERELAAAEAQAKLDAITAQIAEAQKRRDDERDADDKRKDDAAAQEKADDARDEAVAMNLQFDMDANAVRALAAWTPAPAEVLAPVYAALFDAADQATAGDLYPTDAELAGEICALFASEWSMDTQQAAARMATFDFAAALAVAA